MIIDQFLRDLKPKQIFRQTDGQTLNFCMAANLTMVPKWKADLSNKDKFIKVGAFFQKLSWDEM